MLPLPMNEALQENLKQACNVDVKVDAVEWQVLLNASRATPDAASLNGAMALNVSSHQRLVDNPPWLFIVHDLSPRAFSKKVKGFVSPQSWFVELTLVSLE